MHYELQQLERQSHKIGIFSFSPLSLSHSLNLLRRTRTPFSQNI